MAIIATSTGQRELIPAGMYVARCYSMIHIGTIPDNYMGKEKTANKVIIGWEIPELKKVFDQSKGPQPLVISKEYTLFMGDKANLRKMLASWRGKDFSNEEAMKFDVSVLIGVPCMLNIIHKQNQAGTSTYEDIAGVMPLVKGMTCPPQINPNKVWDYDTADMNVFNSLPEFIQTKIISSQEYKKLQAAMPHVDVHENTFYSDDQPHDDLPF